MMRCSSSKAIVAALLLALSGVTTALPSDRDQPISYQADRAERDNQQGTTTLEGSVVMERGSIRIEAERVVIEDQNNKVSLIIATGSPARYRQIPEVGAEPVIASANRLEYRLADQSLHLIENASLVQGGSSLTGNQIDYDARQSVVTAGSDELNRTERVRMVIPAKALQSNQDSRDRQQAAPPSDETPPSETGQQPASGTEAGTENGGEASPQDEGSQDAIHPGGAE